MALAAGLSWPPSVSLADAAVARRPNVLLITVDTLRPDALGWVGGHARTPHLDRLARGGHRFTQAVSPVPLTLPAHVSLMTGLQPNHHGVHDNGQQVPDELETVASRLGALGYRTAAFLSGFPLRRLFGLDRGFVHYDDELPEGEEGFNERRADATVAAAMRWLDTAPVPWFAWIHLYDPHDPYAPPREYWAPGLRGAYDGEVEFVDAALGRLLAGRWNDPDLLVVFTSDHGEALGEHDEETHGYFLYDATVRVPLVVARPGTIPPGECAQQVGLIDVAPTLLEAVGAPPLAVADGRSLAPAWRGEPGATRPLYLETQLPWLYFGWSPLVAVRRDGAKLIAAPRSELYLLDRDPGERDNALEREQATRRELRGSLRELSRSPGRAGRSVADPEAIARLQALGYLGAGAAASPPPSGLPDPKDRIGLRRRLVAADALLRSGDFPGAAAAFEAALADEPTNRMALLRAGLAHLRHGALPQAVERLAAAVAADPQRAEARYLLGDALALSGRPVEAAAEYRQLTRLQPRRFEAWMNLATALADAGQRAEAREALSRARTLAADPPARHSVETLALRLAAADGNRP